MTPIETLRKIVEADQSARSVYSSATQFREGFDDYIAQHEKDIREEIFAKADEAIAAEEKRAAAAADKSIAALDEKLQKELDYSKKRFDSSKASLAERIFKLAVEADA